MAKKEHKPHRADDSRRAGMSDNVIRVARQGSTGSAAPLANLFNDRRGKNGKGKRASK